AGATDHLEIGRGIDQLFGDLGGRADGKAVILADHFGELRLVLAEIGQVVDFHPAILEDLHGGRRKFVGNEYARHGWDPLRWKAPPLRERGSEASTLPSPLMGRGKG